MAVAGEGTARSALKSGKRGCSGLRREGSLGEEKRGERGGEQSGGRAGREWEDGGRWDGASPLPRSLARSASGFVRSHWETEQEDGGEGGKTEGTRSGGGEHQGRARAGGEEEREKGSK